MQKVTFALLVLATLGFTACTKCTVCAQAQGGDEKVCETDYSTEEGYNNAVNSYKSAGYNCYKSI